MSDRTVSYGLRSMARAIASGLNIDAYVNSTDFDYDRRPTNTPNINQPRPLPFAVVGTVQESTPPVFVGDVIYGQDIIVNVEICAESTTKLLERTADLKQMLKSAVGTDGLPGIELYNFAASGVVGTIPIEVGNTEYFGAEDETSYNNRKYRSHTMVTLSVMKDKGAVLLEDLGRWPL